MVLWTVLTSTVIVRVTAGLILPAVILMCAYYHESTHQTYIQVYMTLRTQPRVANDLKSLCPGPEQQSS